VGRPDDAGEHLLGVRAEASAIAAADLLGDDGGPGGLFAAPIGGVDRRVRKQSEHRGEFGGQMGGKWFRRLQPHWPGDQPSAPSSRPRAVARPWSVRHPASRRSRNSRAACRTGVCILTTTATAAAPSYTLAAPSASEVCNPWRP